MGDAEKETVNLNQSRFEIYCEKLNINPNLFMLKATLFMMYGGKCYILNVFRIKSYDNTCSLVVMYHVIINIIYY